MSRVHQFVDRLKGGLAGAAVGQEAIERTLEAAQDAIERSREGVVELELALDEGTGWTTVGQTGVWNFTVEGLRKLISLSRMMFLVNPLIKRAVTVQELYVWGSGYEIKADSEVVDSVLDDFFEDTKNQSVIGDAWPEREREQRIDGNTFFVFFINKANGAARVRLLPVDQMADVICNPDDAKEPWYYKRMRPQGDAGGSEAVLYPDIDFTPVQRPASYNSTPVEWDTPVMHIKTGGLSAMKFGMPELYSVLNWATAYKKILENFATILNAYARLAMKVTGTAGKKGIAAAKSQLGTKLSTSDSIDKNPPPNTASWWLGSGGMDVSPIKTANSTTGPDEARALRSMVAAGSDTPEHFFGDSDIGNFATSTTLDRPTELKMVSRQDMWRKVILRMAGKVIEWSAVAPRGKLRQAGFAAKSSVDVFDSQCRTITITAPADGSLNITVTFPSILSRDVIDRVRAVVMAATLNGSSAEGIIPDRSHLFKMLMVALDEKNADELMKKYYPSETLQGWVDPRERFGLDELVAKGKKELGDAAVTQADAALKKAATSAPVPEPVAPIKKPNK